MIGVCIVAHIIRLICLCRYYDRFSLGQYFLSFIIPAWFIMMVGGMVAFYLKQHFGDVYLQFVIVALLSSLTVFVLAYLLGLNGQEKVFMKHFIKTIIMHRVS
jgi:hypothetical protein